MDNFSQQPPHQAQSQSQDFDSLFDNFITNNGDTAVSLNDNITNTHNNNDNGPTLEVVDTSIDDGFDMGSSMSPNSPLRSELAMGNMSMSINMNMNMNSDMNFNHIDTDLLSSSDHLNHRRRLSVYSDLSSLQGNSPVLGASQNDVFARSPGSMSPLYYSADQSTGLEKLTADFSLLDQRNNNNNSSNTAVATALAAAAAASANAATSSNFASQGPVSPAMANELLDALLMPDASLSRSPDISPGALSFDVDPSVLSNSQTSLSPASPALSPALSAAPSPALSHDGGSSSFLQPPESASFSSASNMSSPNASLTGADDSPVTSTTFAGRQRSHSDSRVSKSEDLYTTSSNNGYLSPHMVPIHSIRSGSSGGGLSPHSTSPHSPHSPFSGASSPGYNLNIPDSGRESRWSQREGRDVVRSSSAKSSHRSTSRSRSRSQTRDYLLELATPSQTNKRVQKHPSVFGCHLCDKRFTRAYNLRSHLRTHTDERPFVCTVCNKAFARQHDRKRHEALHSGEKKFNCKGVLADGVTQWGCGRKFARADALGRHFRTEAGKECIRPLVEEDARAGGEGYGSAGNGSSKAPALTFSPAGSSDANADEPIAGESSSHFPQILLQRFPGLSDLTFAD